METSQTTGTDIFTGWMPFCNPINSVKAQKETLNSIMPQMESRHYFGSTPRLCAFDWSSISPVQLHPE